MANTDLLKPYKPRTYPTLDGGEQQFITGELARISAALERTAVVLALLEARIVALGG